MRQTIRLTINGKPTELSVDPERRLLWVLRTDLGLTGTKFGCGEGRCGSCTVLVDGKATRSCRLKVGTLDGKRVTTIEGLAGDGELHPVQQAFIEHDALQCGYCTPGMIMNAVGLLEKEPEPTREEIVRGMDKNLCRCGAHVRIVDAIETAASRMKGGR